MNGQNLTKFCIHIIIDKIYVGIVNCHFSQICNRVTALDWPQNSVFFQYLENEWTEFNQILYTHYHWQYLHWYCKLSFFANLQQSYGPWLTTEFRFFFNILRMDGQNLTKFCISIIIDKIYVGIVNLHFSQIWNGVMALDWPQNSVFFQYLENEWTEFNQILYTHYHWQYLHWYCKLSFFANLQQSYGPWLTTEFRFFFNILRMDGQNLTKFCIHMIIDKIYVGIVNHHF